MKKADIKNQIRDLVRTKQTQTGTRYFLLCFRDAFKIHIETPEASRCAIMTEAKAMSHLKAHRSTEITIFKTPGETLPDWSKGKKAIVADILPGMVRDVTGFLKFKHPSVYADQTPEAYMEKLTNEERHLMAAYSRIDRFVKNEL